MLGLGTWGLAACSSSPAAEFLLTDAGPQPTVSEAGGQISLSSGADSHSGTGILPPENAVSQCPMPEAQAACIGANFEGKSVPLDIYVMFDQSGSMCNCVAPVDGKACVENPTCNTTRLDAVRQAIKSFLEDPRSTGMGVGIGYFGNQPIGQTSCDPAAYERPAVPIAALPGNAAAITGSLATIAPTGETPTGQAIHGACQYARSWKTAAPGHQVVNLLLTDGKPEAPITCKLSNLTCCPQLDEAVAAAVECRTGVPGIKTYVLGVGPLLENLDQIAVAGGTEKAYLVEGGDVSGKVLEALNRIRGDAAIPCELALPPAPADTRLMLDRVNVTYTDAECRNTTFYYVKDAPGCTAEGGWYYDNVANPQKIQLCKTSCDQVSGPGGRLLYTVGCETKSLILR